MTLVDTHAHLYWDSFTDDLDQVLKRAQEAGVSYIINIGVDVKTSKKALRQAQGKLANIPNLSVYSSIGIHPEEAQKYSDPKKLEEDIEKLEQIYKSDPKTVVAIGECGLDYLHDWAPDEQTKKLQRKLFQDQIDLAKKLHLPLIVHCRQAWDDTIEMTKDCFGIYHCYSGQPEITEKVLKTNFLVSFAGNLTYPKNEYLREAVKIIPLNRIVLETDCPFLPPQSKRGKRNEPAFLLETIETIAQIKGISKESVNQQTNINVKNLFVI